MLDYNIENYPDACISIEEDNTIKIKHINKKGEWEEAKIYLNGNYLNSSYKYKCVKLRNKEGKLKKLYLHKLIAHNFIPNPNNFKEVTFKDGNRLNCNINNLEWVNRKIIFENNIKSSVEKEINKLSLKDHAKDLDKIIDNIETSSVNETSRFYMALGLSVAILCVILFSIFS